jgi:ABC-type multidrug transport system fused ATPase/permease subunit
MAATPDSTLILGLAVPIVLVIAYALGNVIDAGFQQLRDVLFASVGQHAVRKLALRTFHHLHRLSLRFHLARRTGGLSRVIERGTKGIETIVRFTMLNIAPTLVEFVITAVIFVVDVRHQLSRRAGGDDLGLSLFHHQGLELAHFHPPRHERVSDTDANSKAIDSLLNFETVKYFANEKMEADRFDGAMAGYERSAVRIWTSLGFLNFGQAVIFYGRLIRSSRSWRSVGVMNGTLTLGDFVLLNTFLMQIYRPLNFIGFVYREIRQGLTDIEEMFKLLDQNPEIEDKPGAKPLAITGPVIRFEDVHLPLRSRPPDPQGRQLRSPGRQDRRVSSVPPAPASRPSRGCFTASMTSLAARSPSTARTCATSRRRACARPSAWCRRIRCCSTTPSPTTSATVVPDATLRKHVRAAAAMAQVGPFIEALPKGYDTTGGRARPQAVGRREAARRHCPHHPQGAVRS